MNCPVYETVELNEQTQNVSMSCNIAYGNFTQWSFYYNTLLYTLFVLFWTTITVTTEWLILLLGAIERSY